LPAPPTTTTSPAPTITDTIGKANAAVVVTPYNVQWDGNPHTAASTITGVNGQTGAAVGTVTLNTTHTDIGTYNTDSWSFTPSANYNTVAARDDHRCDFQRPTASTGSCRPSAVRLKPRMAAASWIR
jgi:hypothetical protein